MAICEGGGRLRGWKQINGEEGRGRWDQVTEYDDWWKGARRV